jgi:hypothetical protein
LYCGKVISNIQEHLERRHGNEADVQAVKNLEKGSAERSRLQAILRNRGNFKYNTKVLQENSGEIFVVRRPEETCYADQYLPCPDCFGFYMSYDMWKHQCPGSAEEKRLDLKRRAKILLVEATSPGIDESTLEILKKMVDGPVKDTILGDNIIKKFISYLADKHDSDARNQDQYIRERARTLARFLLQVREEPDCSDLTLENLLSNPKHFDIAVKSTFEVSKNTIGMSRKIGHSLRKCLVILRGQAMRTANYDLLSNVKLFDDLMTTEWSDIVSSKSLKKQYQAKLNKQIEIPTKEDLMTLATGIDDQFKSALANCKETVSKANWRKLAELLLAKIVVFNKRRAGEASRLKLEDYQKVSGHLNAQIQQELFEALKESDKVVASKHLVVYCPGKRGRHVPMILTLEMKAAIDFLNSSRKKAGILSNNPYVFATPDTSNELLAHQILNKLSKQFGVKNCNSTALRKYLATTVQALSLKDSELDYVANHLGHDIRIHRQFYRMDDATIELAKISKLLHLSKSGKLHENKGKSLEELDYCLTSDSESEQDNDEADGQDSELARKGRKRKIVSEDEKLKIIKHFESEINHLQLPLKTSIMAFLRKEKSSLEWLQVKSVLASAISSKKRKQSGPTNEDSESLQPEKTKERKRKSEQQELDELTPPQAKKNEKDQQKKRH